jgi:chromosome segregation ATPase
VASSLQGYRAAFALLVLVLCWVLPACGTLPWSSESDAGEPQDRDRDRGTEALELQEDVEARIGEAEERLDLVQGDLVYLDDATSEVVRSEIGDVRSVLEELREILEELRVAEGRHLEEVEAEARRLLEALEDHFEAIDSLLGPVPKEVP